MSVSKSLRAMALAVVLVSPLAAPAHAGDWKVDTSVACRVWNPHPQPNEGVRWSGACVNGFAQGRGTVQWIRNNVPYETDEGEWREGYQTGYGTQVWPSGRYDGGLVQSEPEGGGKFVLQTSHYEGEFHNGKPNGTGTLTSPSGEFHGTWTDGCFHEGAKKTAFGVPLSTCP
jgi:hypothetical protein